MKTERILETCLYADDLGAAAAFYGEVLGLVPYSRVEGRHAFFRCGQQMFLLFRAAGTLASDHVPPHGATGPGHVAFAVAEEQLSTWREHLRAHGIAIEQEVEWPGGNRSLYFRDPAGNSVELAVPAIWGLRADSDLRGPA